jgi:predicted GH43/DUF377 family glycosyl hydrolase
MEPIPVRRSRAELFPAPRRVVARPYRPGAVGQVTAATRLQDLVDRVLALSPAAVEETLNDIRERFADRHHDLDDILEESFVDIRKHARLPSGLTHTRRALLGAYFVREYSIEAAALTNPSIVPAPDQTGTAPGCVRIIVSLRAVGEGHLSSIELRTGMIHPDGEVTIDDPLPPRLGRRQPPLFDKSIFRVSLREVLSANGMHDHDPERRRSPEDAVLDLLGDRFTMEELEDALDQFDPPLISPDVAALTRSTVHWLAASNYELSFPARSRISQRVLFPSGPAESNGMEDARFARFTDDDGSCVYVGTYTAYDGFHILPQLIETQEFATFRIATMTGAAARNKGIALFPRRINGAYVALARSDNENNFVMYSDHLRVWKETEVIQVPVRPWELIQIGNNGTPIETDAGWLVITHGVGPFRTYALGAILLDLENPSKVIGHLPEPLLTADEDERDGYVPNVVYSCGQLLHEGRVVLAYGASDLVTRFASVSLDTLLHELTSRSSSLTAD